MTWYDRSLQRIKMPIEATATNESPYRYPAELTHPQCAGRTGLTDLLGVLAVPSPVV